MNKTIQSTEGIDFIFILSFRLKKALSRFPLLFLPSLPLRMWNLKNSDTLSHAARVPLSSVLTDFSVCYNTDFLQSLEQTALEHQCFHDGEYSAALYPLRPHFSTEFLLLNPHMKLQNLKVRK